MKKRKQYEVYSHAIEKAREHIKAYSKGISKRICKERFEYVLLYIPDAKIKRRLRIEFKLKTTIVFKLIEVIRNEKQYK